ncbi:hypothetical protein ACS0TY_004092 [Phlomoides rotata]
MKFLKDPSLSFSHDRFDIFRSLSPQDIQSIVEKGCPSLLRKVVNSAKSSELPLYLLLGAVCGLVSVGLTKSTSFMLALLDGVERGAGILKTVDLHLSNGIWARAVVPNVASTGVYDAPELRDGGSEYLVKGASKVYSSCNLRESCDRAYIMPGQSEDGARTVDVVRLLLFCVLDPLVISGESKPPGRELVESSARKLLLELVEFGERLPDPDLPKPASITAQRKKQSLDLSYNKSSKNVDMKLGDWVCTKCELKRQVTKTAWCSFARVSFSEMTLMDDMAHAENFRTIQEFLDEANRALP